MDKGFHHKMIPWLDKEALHHRHLHLCTFLSQLHSALKYVDFFLFDFLHSFQTSLKVVCFGKHFFNQKLEVRELSGFIPAFTMYL